MLTINVTGRTRECFTKSGEIESRTGYALTINVTGLVE